MQIECDWRSLYSGFCEMSDPVDLSLRYFNSKIATHEKFTAIEGLKDLYMIAHIEKDDALSDQASVLRKVFQLNPFSMVDLEIAMMFSQFGFEHDWRSSGIYYAKLITTSNDFNERLESEYGLDRSRDIYHFLCDLIADGITSSPLICYRSVQLCHLVAMKALQEKNPQISDEQLYLLAIQNAGNEQGLGSKITFIKCYSHNPIAVQSELIDSFFWHCLDYRFFQCSYLIDPEHKRVVDRLRGRYSSDEKRLLYALRVSVQNTFLLTRSNRLLAGRLKYISRIISEIVSSKSGYDIFKFIKTMKRKKLKVVEIEGIIEDWHGKCLANILALNPQTLTSSDFAPHVKMSNDIYHSLRGEAALSKRLTDNLLNLCREALRIKNFDIAICLYNILHPLNNELNDIAETFKRGNYPESLRQSSVPPVPVIGFMMRRVKYAESQGKLTKLGNFRSAFERRQTALKAAYPLDKCD